ncbi:uncharacterized protein B0H18DRAFT_1125503 [Fomitopsis serialis]|uniref:uncharacterized protein n=1 Tax=Fomitopsis serialis TaxID=139415 RepID=UPI0020073B79|nr:uncharacterized protein B0H18DRAFT_1125503 [Neoantrodia serialis]KAH9914466.1 hypothetical protein B0H18DRAFT_1125503 [Neoantrodia serialis]
MPSIRQVTVTDPSAPQETKIRGATEVPEINGSPVAFIALVVSLGVVVLVCSVLVFILLKRYNPTPYERQLRRARRLQRKQARSDSPSSAFHAPSWLSRLTRVFGRRRSEGWVRASGEDGDEWDARDELPSYNPQREQQVHQRDPSPLHVDTHLPRRDEDASADSVELQAPEHSEHPATRYSDPFVSSPSPTSTEHSNGPPTPKETREGRFSVQTAASSPQRQVSDAVSIRSMRKFESGTKFKEALEF